MLEHLCCYIGLMFTEDTDCLITTSILKLNYF